MEAIIVSGMPAVGKTTVSKIIGQTLELKVMGGGDVLKEMAVEEGYTPGGDDWWDTEEGMKFLRERKKSASFDKEVDERLLQKAKRGDVVITSYTLPWLSVYGAKVWLSGSVSSRAKRMARRDHSEVAKCREVLKVRDLENRKLYKKLYGVSFGRDLKPFDLVVSTDAIDEEKVATIILKFVKSRARG